MRPRADDWQEQPEWAGPVPGGVAWRAMAGLCPDRAAVYRRWAVEDRALVAVCENDLGTARERLAEAEASEDPERVERAWRSVVSFEDKLRRLVGRAAKPRDPPAVLEGRAGQRRQAKPVAAAIEARLRGLPR